jgi:predicted Zn-dependent peptidase
VFNGIFGGFPHSKLFLNVREKNSLAYYASSRVESHKGLLMVMSGIEMKNYERALTIIHEQMEAMKKGDFTDKELEQTKAVIKNQLLETIDTPYGMTEVLYHNVVAKTNRTIEEWIEGVEKVQKDEIVQLAEKIQLDTVYFLKGGGSL